MCQAHPNSIDAPTLDEFGPYLGDTALSVLSVLRRHRNEDGQAWPSVATIAFYVRRSKPTVLQAIAALEQVALIRVERSRGKGQMRDRNRYELLSVEGARERLRALLADGTLRLTEEQRAYLEDEGGPHVRRLHVVKPVDNVVNEVDHAQRSKSALLRGKAGLLESEIESLFQVDSESLCISCHPDTVLAAVEEACQVGDGLIGDLRPDPEPAAPPPPQAALFTDAVSSVAAPEVPKARKPRPRTPRSDIEDALAAVCWPGMAAREVWALYGGMIRRYAKEIDEANASLEVPITGQEIRDRCAPAGIWYRTCLALDAQRRPTKHPTPAAIRKWLRNLEHMTAAVDGVSRTPPPPAPPVIWTASGPPPEPVSADMRRAARQQAWKETRRDARSQPLTRQDRPAPPDQRPP